ncbi:MAG TPA: ABC transporter permease [Steroidobacteraceae bacterium]|nr:ABC transporter permease [Steroidobacteraceae bacterium]
MSAIGQFLALLRVSLSELLLRRGPVLTIFVGVGCAVGVLVSMLAMGSGARREEMSNVRDDRVVIAGLGQRPLFGSIPREEAAAVQDLPGIRRDGNGRPIVVMESMIPIDGRRQGSGARIFVPLFGVTPNVTAYRPEMRFTAGRMFHPGLRELVTSNACTRLFSGFGLGDVRPIRGTGWTIVGHFDLGKASGCTIFADVNMIMSAFARDTYSGLEVMLQSPADLAAFRAAIKANPALHLEAIRQRVAVAQDFKELNAILDFASYFVGIIMAVGGTLGAVNSLYAIVDARRRELATLRAIGFRPGTIVACTLCESMLLAVPGALLGALLAWLLFNGLSASPFGYSFRLDVTPALVLLGVIWALAMGFIGGILPAVRAARVPVATALRAV